MIDRVKKLRAVIGDDDLVYITGNANVYYYSGFLCDDSALLISKSESIFITDFRYVEEAKIKAADFTIYTKKLNGLFSSFSESNIWIEEDYLTVAQMTKLREAAPGKKLTCNQAEISKPRRIKEPKEIEKIKKAESIGDVAFEKILSFIRPGVSERKIAAELEYTMNALGASGTSFKTICASGVRSSMPHGTASDKIIKDGDFVTLDFGCICDGYCSDMTRTVGIGNVPQKLIDIYNIVLEAQMEAIKQIKPQMKCSDCDGVARNIIKEAGYGEIFGHSLGHSVGIEIHENPNLSPKSKDILMVGNVVTVEPGIYVPDLGGVRIEDVVVITDDGCMNITKSKKELIIL